MANGVYWVGADNNIYTKASGQTGVKNVGPNGVTNPNNFKGLQLIQDPSQQGHVLDAFDANGTAAGGGSTTDPASFDQAINSTNSQIAGLDPALNNLLQGAHNNYQTTINSLDQGKATADQGYKTGKTTNAQNYVTNKNDIRADTGATISNVDRVIGSGGGGGQAAGDYAALLAGKAGSKQLAASGTAFGKNEQSLDTNYNTYLAGDTLNRTNAGLQQEADINDAQGKIKSQKAGLLTGLADLINKKTAAGGGRGTAASQPYLNQATQLQNEATLLSAPRPVAAQAPITYTAPELSTYTTNPTTVTPGGQGQGATTDSVLPFVNKLLNRKQLQTA